MFFFFDTGTEIVSGMIDSGFRRRYVWAIVIYNNGEFNYFCHAAVANFAAYTFAPPILVTPLGALSVLIGYVFLRIVHSFHPSHMTFLQISAVLASFLLHEELGHLGRVGCTLCLLGSLIIVLHAPADKPVEAVDEILHFALQPGV